ncbi:hypothetical protein Val02_17810 [Virgisporangium aliadipatigenens]|uniref:Methyltransferase n=1 Tax=Virgisporangium aliadipatigenens TaxID=741659 RepID=A0A8J3YJ52_9ACTN|nr:hypothetical protein Val02_17810 [Virgisporangium aliadipatigenens]
MRPGGGLALFWNADDLADPVARQRFQEVHERHKPGFLEEYVPLSDEWVRDWEAYRDLAGAPGFEEPEWRIYRAGREMSTVDYVAFLDTVSRYRLLDDAVRAALYADLCDALGERVTLDVDTVLLLARRSGDEGP